MQDMNEAVERIEPMPAERGDWDGVVRDARRRRPVLLGSVGGVALAAAALFAFVLFQPTERRTFLERALAAVDDGPVLHAVLRGDWGGTNIDLRTGARTPVHGETEIWYDAQRRRIRVASRLGETVIHESAYEENRASPELIALARDYRAALESGSARIAGEDVIDGEHVTWVVVLARILPHGDGKLREWTVQVAVSNETYKPVATQDFVDGGAAGKGTLQHVLELEAVSADDVDLDVPQGKARGVYQQAGGEPIALDRAGEVLGRTPVWLGREHSGLALARVSETWTREGTQEATRLEGQAAEDARACRHGPVSPEEAARATAACDRHRARLRGAYYAPVVWGEKKLGVSYFYGTLGDDPKTYRKDIAPLETEPFVQITETVEQPARVVGGAYFPSEGSMFIGAGNRQGNLRHDGLYVLISASTPELILSAARALKPMS